MNSGFDEGDFKKARGMLLSFSSILISLWFFGADLKSVSLFGTTIAFTQNTQHVWLVALAINSYFLLRFYQHSPNASYSENKIYQSTFEDFLIKNMQRLKKEKIKEDLFQNLKHLGAQESDNYKHEIVRTSFSTVTNPQDKRKFSRGFARIANFQVRGEYKNLDATELKTSPVFEYGYSCPYWLVVLATYRAKIAANVKTSYGTEYLLPYLWSSWAAVICMHQWFVINKLSIMKA
jgi:hypothetical protein